MPATAIARRTAAAGPGAATLLGVADDRGVQDVAVDGQLCNIPWFVGTLSSSARGLIRRFVTLGLRVCV
ncbi:hypothetical protein [Streptomyces mirabilis]|uniref:hypothetical protein n=1 Tax=Streptomyces mirabilis TaxID=68239 RepID=UPI0033BB48A5